MMMRRSLSGRLVLPALQSFLRELCNHMLHGQLEMIQNPMLATSIKSEIHVLMECMAQAPNSMGRLYCYLRIIVRVCIIIFYASSFHTMFGCITRLCLLV